MSKSEIQAPIQPRVAPPPLLVGQLLLLAASTIFLAIFTAVRIGEIQAFDEWTLVAMRDSADLGRAIGPAWLTQLAVMVTMLGSDLILTAVVLLGAVWFQFRGDRKALRLLLLAGIGGLFLLLSLKFSIGRPRPEIVPWLTTADAWSFPSGHAMMTMSVFVTLAVLVGRGLSSQRIRTLLILVAIALSISAGLTRIFLAVHYPSDVLAGWMVGLAWLSACWLWDARKRKHVRPKLRKAVKTKGRKGERA